jgi:hypothetical protein
MQGIVEAFQQRCLTRLHMLAAMLALQDACLQGIRPVLDPMHS